MNKALNTIGICKCANKISYGETLIKDIKNHNVYLVIICLDTSFNSKKKIIGKCKFYNCEYLEAFSKEEIIKAISRTDQVSAIGIKDSNLAKKFKENIGREGDING
jgi:ribosomal protein L7Ae-like RNA K-turn-binding protein